MNSILNYDFYNNEMQKGLSDKLFFMKNEDILKNVRTIMDYGCADGALIQEMSALYPSINFVGFDLDEEMVRQANLRKIDKAYFFDNFEKAKKKMDVDAILCSSVIHEVYSYGTKESIDLFWNNLNNGNHDYIIIRDMSMSKDDPANETLDMKMLNNVLKYGDSNQVREFENIWGRFRTTSDIIHFLFKYRYTDNWKREVEENYFPVFNEDYDKLIDMSKFEKIYHEHYLLPYQKEIILKDFNVEIKSKTHVKMIFKRR